MPSTASWRVPDQTCGGRSNFSVGLPPVIWQNTNGLPCPKLARSDALPDVNTAVTKQSEKPPQSACENVPAAELPRVKSPPGPLPPPMIATLLATLLAPGYQTASPFVVARIASGCANNGCENGCHTSELHHCPVSIGPSRSVVLKIVSGSGLHGFGGVVR